LIPFVRIVAGSIPPCSDASLSILIFLREAFFVTATGLLIARRPFFWGCSFRFNPPVATAKMQTVLLLRAPVGDNLLRRQPTSQADFFPIPARFAAPVFSPSSFLRLYSSTPPLPLGIDFLGRQALVTTTLRISSLPAVSLPFAGDQCFSPHWTEPNFPFSQPINWLAVMIWLRRP